jgi:hypothetical protein
LVERNKPNFQDLIIAGFRCALPSLRPFKADQVGRPFH